MRASTDQILNTRNAEACRRIVDNSVTPGTMPPRFDSGTLAGCIEHFLLNANCSASASTRREIRGNARDAIEPWASILASWSGTGAALANVFQPRRVEFELIDVDHWEDRLNIWNLFEQRFHSALVHAGFDSSIAIGLMQVFHEMADNVVQHGKPSEGRAMGIAAYHVEPKKFAFSIGDLGCGFLRSLRTSPSWSHLETDREALLAVIHRGASRRAGQGEGEGFKQLWKALADHGALVRIRSCGAVASIRPTPSGREAETSTTPNADGAHVSVCCSLGKSTAEEDLKIFFTPSLE